jgi:hypothetical protein
MISNLLIPPDHQPRTKPKAASIGVSPILTESAYLEKGDVFIKLKTSPGGLTKTEAEERLIKYGPNAVAMEKQRGWLWRPSGTFFIEARPRGFFMMFLPPELAT